MTSNLQSIFYLVLRIIHWNQAELLKSQSPNEALMTLPPKLFWRFGCHCSPFAVNPPVNTEKNPPEAPWLPFPLHLCFISRPWYCEQFRMSILIKPEESSLEILPGILQTIMNIPECMVSSGKHLEIIKFNFPQEVLTAVQSS